MESLPEERGSEKDARGKNIVGQCLKDEGVKRENAVRVELLRDQSFLGTELRK